MGVVGPGVRVCRSRFKTSITLGWGDQGSQVHGLDKVVDLYSDWRLIRRKHKHNSK